MDAVHVGRGRIFALLFLVSVIGCGTAGSGKQKGDPNEGALDRWRGAMNLGRVEMGRRDFARAEGTFRRAVELGAQVGEGGDAHRQALVSLGQAQKLQGKIEEAEATLREGLAANDALKTPDPADRALVLDSLGEILCHTGRFDEAGEALAENLALREKVYGDISAEVALALRKLGRLRLFEGKWDEATSAFARAYAIYQTGIKSGHMPLVLVLLGRSHLEAGRHARALELFGPAFDTIARAAGPNCINLAEIGLLRARALEALGRGEEAEKARKAAFSVLNDTGGVSVNMTPEAYFELGEYLRGRRDLIEAKKYFDGARREAKMLGGTRYPGWARFAAAGR